MNGVTHFRNDNSYSKSAGKVASSISFNFCLSLPRVLANGVPPIGDSEQYQLRIKLFLLTIRTDPVL